MKDPVIQKPSLKALRSLQRKSVAVSHDTLLSWSELQTGASLPLLASPAVEGVDLMEWAQTHRAFVDAPLLNHGAILFRGFQIRSSVEFEQLLKSLFGSLLEYTNRSTPRRRVSGSIYTSTEYPPDQSIPLHNEMSYTTQWPMKIGFFCVKPAEQQGETPIADSRRIFHRIPSSIRDRFIEKKVMYIRNYGAKMDLSWEDVFQTTEKADVENFCRKAHIDFEWREGGRLRTRQICQAVAQHPKTGEMVWFNQAHLFHVSSLPPEVREMLLSTFREEDLPRNACYGDGSSIETTALDEIRAALQDEAILFPWQEGDILVMDNMLAAHGRQPFTGAREVVVGMAEPFNAESGI